MGALTLVVESFEIIFNTIVKRIPVPPHPVLMSQTKINLCMRILSNVKYRQMVVEAVQKDK